MVGVQIVGGGENGSTAVAGDATRGVVSEVDDLRPCNPHKIPVNRCAACWPGYLKWLGRKVWVEWCEEQRLKVKRREEM